MRLTGAFLAEAARTVDGKLEVRGGVVRYFVVGPDRIVMLSLVVLVEFQPDDGPVPGLTLEFVTPSGDSQTMRVDLPAVVGSGQEIGYAYWPLWLPAEQDGAYVLSVSGDEGTVKLPLTVMSS